MCIIFFCSKSLEFFTVIFQLTFVISMIGNPPLVLMDEPSTGMDPQSKRNLWDMIQQSFGDDRGAILTTHSMEEADALCSRIGIIVQGELRCIGSSQHLKDKFGSGYALEIKLALEADGTVDDHASVVARVKGEIGVIFPGAVCTEEFYNRFVFAVPKDQIPSLGWVFGELDRGEFVGFILYSSVQSFFLMTIVLMYLPLFVAVKQVLNLEEYSFSQTVFHILYSI